MKYLLIAEKPSLMREIQACYNNNKDLIRQRVGLIDFCALAGHVCADYTPDDYPEWADTKWNDIDYPIVPSQWGVKPIDNKRDILKKIGENIKNYDGIIVGTDSDIEGYGIYWKLEHYLHLENMKALRFVEHSLTEQEILESLLSMTDYHKDPVHVAATNAYLVRSRADWLFGMNCTRIMSLKRNVLLRVGRVKAATLGIVYNNSMAIENFKPEKYFQIQADYGDFASTLIKEDGTIAEYKDKPDTSKYPLSGFVKKKTTKRSYEHAPKLFDLTAIQAEAGRKYKYTPAHTLEIVQSLYEKHKVISYPRTQCRFVSSEKAKEFKMMLTHMSVFDDLREIARRVTDEDIQRVMSDKQIVNDKEVAKESHDALLPTSNRANPSKMTEEEYNVCHMIYARLLSQFLPQAADDKTELIITHGDGDFIVRGKTVVEQGWRILFKEAKDVTLPLLNEGDKVQAQKIGPIEKVTKPLARLTQPTLINAMQNIANIIEDKELRASLAQSKGIGTPATRANIIKELISSNYMEDKKGGLYITKLGKEYIQSLDGIDIVSPVFAAKLDMEMKKVQNREESYDEAYQYVYQELIRLCKSMQAIETKDIRNQTQSQIDEVCPFCGAPVVDKKFAYLCSESCGFKVSKEILGKKLDEKALHAICTKGSTPKYAFKSKSGKRFKASLKLDKETKALTFSFDDNGKGSQMKKIGTPCPMCYNGQLTMNDKAVSCKACNFFMRRVICGHKLSNKEVNTLLKVKRLNDVTGLKGKSGKTFTADLVLANDGSIKFVFKQ